MTDWADDIAWMIEPWPCIGEEPDRHRKTVAIAIRRAKADGMRECAEMLDGNGKWNCAPSCLFDDEAMRWAKHFREAASRTENTLGTLGATTEQNKADADAH